MPIIVLTQRHPLRILALQVDSAYSAACLIAPSPPGLPIAPVSLLHLVLRQPISCPAAHRARGYVAVVYIADKQIAGVLTGVSRLTWLPIERHGNFGPCQNVPDAKMGPR